MSGNALLELRLHKFPFSLKLSLFGLNFSMYDIDLINYSTAYNQYHVQDNKSTSWMLVLNTSVKFVAADLGQFTIILQNCHLFSSQPYEIRQLIT